jgi:hypothetical protein
VNEDPQHAGREQRRQQLGEELKKLQDMHELARVDRYSLEPTLSRIATPFFWSVREG